MTSRQRVLNNIIDYIPLNEITAIDYEMEALEDEQQAKFAVWSLCLSPSFPPCIPLSLPCFPLSLPCFVPYLFVPVYLPPFLHLHSIPPDLSLTPSLPSLFLSPPSLSLASPSLAPLSFSFSLLALFLLIPHTTGASTNSHGHRHEAHPAAPG